MCWLLNNQLSIELKRMPDFNMGAESHRSPSAHAVYQYEHASMYLKILLIANKTNETILLSDPKNIDYLLLFKDPGNHQNLQQRLSLIRKIPHVQAAVLLNNLNTKQASEFFFDLEMYLSRLP